MSSNLLFLMYVCIFILSLLSLLSLTSSTSGSGHNGYSYSVWGMVANDRPIYQIEPKRVPAATITSILGIHLPESTHNPP